MCLVVELVVVLDVVLVVVPVVVLVVVLIVVPVVVRVLVVLLGRGVSLCTFLAHLPRTTFLAQPFVPLARAACLYTLSYYVTPSLTSSPFALLPFLRTASYLRHTGLHSRRWEDGEQPAVCAGPERPGARLVPVSHTAYAACTAWAEQRCADLYARAVAGLPARLSHQRHPRRGDVRSRRVLVRRHVPAGQRRLRDGCGTYLFSSRRRARRSALALCTRTTLALAVAVLRWSRRTRASRSWSTTVKKRRGVRTKTCL